MTLRLYHTTNDTSTPQNWELIPILYRRKHPSTSAKIQIGLTGCTLIIFNRNEWRNSYREGKATPSIRNTREIAFKPMHPATVPCTQLASSFVMGFHILIPKKLQLLPHRNPPPLPLNNTLNRLNGVLHMIMNKRNFTDRMPISGYNSGRTILPNP